MHKYDFRFYATQILTHTTALYELESELHEELDLDWKKIKLFVRC